MAKNWMRVVTLAACVGGLLNLALAQVVVQPGPVGQAYKYVNPMGQSLNWLYSQQIQKEIELVAEQQEKIDKVRTEVQGKMRELAQGLQEGDPAERYKKYNERAQALGDDTEKRIREILLPHQVKRLEQIGLQMKFASAGYGYGAADALSAEELVRALEITDEQKALMRKKEEEIRAEAQKKTQEFYKSLNDEAREKLFSVLTPAQRKKLDDLFGEKFTWQAPVWQNPPRGAGGTGRTPGETQKN